MLQLFHTVLEAALAAVVLLPILLILNHFRFRNLRTTFFYFLFTVYLAGVYAVVGLPNVAYLRFEINLNLIPLAGILSDLSGTALNLVMFIPLGIFLSLLWKKYRSAKQAVFFGFSMSLAIEILQIFTFRATDINDLITNTAGTFLGWLIGCLMGQLIPSLKGRNRTSDLPLLFLTSASVMFFFQPVIWAIID